MLKTYFQSEIALGSKVTLLIVAREVQEDEINRTIRELWKIIFQFEKQFSRFLPNSELSEFNRTAGPKNPITPEFRDLLSTAKQLSQATEGLFNPFILPALQRAGYKKSMVAAYSEDIHDDYSHLQVAPAESLLIGDTWASIPYGSAIDMGGCGKGYIADILSTMVSGKDIEGFWFSLGGDIVGGGRNAEGKTWSVAIQESDDDPKADAPVVQASGKPFAVATSGTNARKGIEKGKAWHHILDPRTQKPARTDLFMASVYGPSAVHADVLASCAILLGSHAAMKFLKKQPEVEAALLQGIGEDGSLKIYSFGRQVKINGSITREQANV